MSINTSYQQHREIMKELQMPKDFLDVKKPYQEDFQKIYQDAKEKNINIHSAKEYLRSLSKDEMQTLQNYARLVDEIVIEGLSDEGAYNLLLEHYEKYDFNGDGLMENGIGKSIPLIPFSLSNDEKRALVKTFNEMDFKDVMMASILLLPPPVINGDYRSNNRQISFDDIQKKVDFALDPKNEEYSTPEFKETIQKFWERLMFHFDKIQADKAHYKIT